MPSFAIIEVDDGFEVLEIFPGQSAEDAAAAAGGELIDPGPYDSYDEGINALDQLEVFDKPEAFDEFE